MDKILESIDVSKLTTDVVGFLPRVATALLIFIGFLLVYRITRPTLEGVLNRANFHEALVRLIVRNIYRYVMVIVGLIMAADQLGVNIGAALAGIGVAGIAIGFAAQDSVANVISGILIFWDKPFVVGDWIETEGMFGKVNNITLRSTRIRTPRNTYVVIPNKNIIDATLENYSKHGELRVDVPLGIAYKENIPEARRVLLAAVDKLDWLRKDPQPDVVVEELGGSSVNLKVRVWIDDPEQRQKTFFAMMEACKLALDEAEIQIPFPHLQLFVDNVEEPVWKRAAELAGRA